MNWNFLAMGIYPYGWSAQIHWLRLQSWKSQARQGSRIAAELYANLPEKLRPKFNSVKLTPSVFVYWFVSRGAAWRFLILAAAG